MRKDDYMGKRIFFDLSDEKSRVTGTCQLFDVQFPGKSYGSNGYTSNIPFILDCGSFQGEEDDDLLNSSFKFDITRPEFGILTHAHLDHYGRYPMAISKGFQAPIFTSYVTKTFLREVFLEDCLKIENRHAKKKGIEPAYTISETQKMCDYMIGCAYHKEIKYNDNISIYFFDNGHVPGAVVTLVQLTYPGYEDVNIVISGDYNNYNTFFKVNPLPQWVYNLPNLTIIIESTYGTTKISDLSPACFIKNIVKGLNNNKIVFIPTFSFVQTQQVDYVLKEAQDVGILDTKYSIYNDGKTSIGCNNLFLEGVFKMYPHTKDFLPQNFTSVENKELRKFLQHDTTPKIIVAPSGMGSHGASRTYIDKFSTNSNALIHATGYLSPNSKLGMLRDSNNIAATLCYTDEFSAHAKSEVLKGFIKPFNYANVKSIIVTHGEPDVENDFSKDLEETFGIKTYVLSSNVTFRITSNGVVQTFERRNCL